LRVLRDAFAHILACPEIERLTTADYAPYHGLTIKWTHFGFVKTTSEYREKYESRKSCSMDAWKGICEVCSSSERHARTSFTRDWKLARGGLSGNGSKQRTIVKRGKAEGSRNETLRRGVKITD
jgi:hypothetical protein